MQRRISPLPSTTSRRAGQSLEQRQQRILFRQALLMSGLAFGFGLLLGAFWLPRTPETGFILLGLTFLSAIAAVITDRWLDRRWHAATLGRQGEEHVGHALQELISCGARIVHDVAGPIGNIDHVIFHPSGIYVIETKTWSRDYKRLTSLSFDGKVIRRNGRPALSNPVWQVVRAAKWLRTHFQGTLGLNFKCRVEAVVVFPGWHVVVEREHPHASILSIESLIAKIKASETRALSVAQVKYFADLLEKSAG